MRKADTSFDSKGQFIRFLSHFYKYRCLFLMPSKIKVTSNEVAVKNPTKPFLRYADAKTVSMPAVREIKAACADCLTFCGQYMTADKCEHGLAGGHAVVSCV